MSISKLSKAYTGANVPSYNKVTVAWFSVKLKRKVVQAKKIDIIH